MNGYYWIYLILLGALLCWESASRPDTRRAIYWASAGFLVLLFALQDDSVSMDLPEYMTQWALIPQLTLPEMLVHKFEIGFVLLCRVLYGLFGNPRVLVVVLGVGIVGLYSRWFDRETEEPMIALMAFLATGMYTYSMIFWRQLMAMAILTLSTRFIRQRKLLPFLLTVVAAMTFHKTSALFVILYPLYRAPMKKWLLLLCGGVSLVAAVFGRRLIRLAIQLALPLYRDLPLNPMGGGTLLAVLWLVTLAAWWLLEKRMEEPAVRLPLLMTLVAATAQSLCMTTYHALRVVLIFQVGLAPLTAQLCRELLRNPENRVMGWLRVHIPRLHGALVPCYGKKWFAITGEVLLFAALFVWFARDLDGGVYTMAPVI